MKYNQEKIKEVAGELALAFTKNYKCSLDEASSFFLDNILKQDEVAKLVDASANPKQLARNAVFRNFVKKCKKELYYQLRKYKSDDASLQSSLDAARKDPSDENLEQVLSEVAQFHVSSQERFEENEIFYDKLNDLFANAETIIDAGCGVQPLFFPFGRFSNVKRYAAIDKDKASIALMQEIKSIFPQRYQWLYPDVWNIGEGWDNLCTEHDVEEFDLALMLKVVAVVQRTNPELVNGLCKVPAKTIVVSGVKESMVKKQDIGRRERRLVLNFMESCGRQKIAEFDLDNEFIVIG